MDTVQTTTSHARVMTLQGLKQRRQTVPESWRKAAGMLEGRDSIDPVQYQKEIRAEWEQRFQKQLLLAGINQAHDD